MKAIAPAKIILSGEHAVVYGQPAVVQAVNLYSYSRLKTDGQADYTFILPNLSQKTSLTLLQIANLRDELLNRYDRFLHNKLKIQNVVSNPIHPFAYILARCLEKKHIENRKGATLTIESNIPIGCGMGSSSAIIASTIMVLCAQYRVKIPLLEFFNLVFEIEKFFHGTPSGVDPYITVHGGTIKFHNKKAEILPTPKFPLFLAHTGRPESSTGQCVAKVKETHGKTAIWTQFAETTREMINAIKSKNKNAFCASIRQNHRLLKKIGVVPPAVQNFISDIEALNGAAKITGAGSIKGNGGGMVLICMDRPPLQLLKAYNYDLMTIHEDPKGVRTI